MIFTFEKAKIDVTKLSRLEDTAVNRYGFEVRPLDGTPYHSGYIETFTEKGAARQIYDAYLQGILYVYQKQY